MTGLEAAFFLSAAVFLSLSLERRASRKTWTSAAVQLIWLE